MPLTLMFLAAFQSAGRAYPQWQQMNASRATSGYASRNARSASTCGTCCVGHNRQHEDTLTCGLVGYEGAHLEECPSFEPTALSLASRCPVPNPCKMLAGDGRPCVFGLGDQSVTNSVVLIRPHVGFPQTDFPQLPLGTFGAGTLAGSTHARIALTACFHAITTECLAVIRGGEVLDAQIDANNASRLLGVWSAVHQNDVQEETSVPSFDQRSTARDTAFESTLLVVAQRRLKSRSAVEQRQAKGPVPLPKAEDTLIVVNRRGLKSRVCLGRDLERRTDTRNSPNGQVGRQAKALADVVVAGMLNLHFVTRMDRTRDVSHKVAGIGEGHKRSVQFGALLIGRHKFTGNRAYRFHKDILSHAFITYNHHG